MSNLIDASITPAQLTAIEASVQSIKDNLPVVNAISAKEIKAKQKLGDNGLSFVNKAATYGETYFSVMAKDYNVAEVKKDKEIYAALSGIEAKLMDVLSSVQLMRTLAGIDQMSQGNSVYAALKEAAKKDASLKPIVDELGEFYKKSKKEDKPLDK